MAIQTQGVSSKYIYITATLNGLSTLYVCAYMFSIIRKRPWIGEVLRAHGKNIRERDGDKYDLNAVFTYEILLKIKLEKNRALKGSPSYRVGDRVEYPI